VLGRLDDDQIQATVGFHVVRGLVSADQVVPGASFETLTGETLIIGEDGTLPGGVEVTTTDLPAANGLVHIVDSVIVPGSVRRDLTTTDINQLFELEPIQFATGSADILNESVPTLDQAVVLLSQAPAGSQFEVQGHTDSAGDDEPNQVLSEARAVSVLTYLVDNGTSPDLLVAVGYGETQLKVDPDLTSEDKAMNRRIEFVDISAG
jgi:outer membrane protein OmpA-like peptidoglycan-associated protein